MSATKHPAVAARFYPGETAALQQMISQMLQAARKRVTHINRCPKAIIAPHAGYLFSGPTAAAGYEVLTSFADKIKHVTIFGPAHYVPLFGLACASYNFFETPLGALTVQKSLREKILQLPQVNMDDKAFIKEHSLEVHLPFLQMVLKEFTILPILVGQANQAQIAEVIEACWGDEHSLIVISSDLSHYLSYEQAQAIDQETSKAIESLQGNKIDYEQACGKNPIVGMLLAAERHKLQVKTIEQCNSGDTAGDKSRVVGYASYHFYMADV